MGVVIGPMPEYRKHTLDIGAHFVRLEAELRRKEAQAQSDHSSGSVGGSDQAGKYQICEKTEEMNVCQETSVTRRARTRSHSRQRQEAEAGAGDGEDDTIEER